MQEPSGFTWLSEFWLPLLLGLSNTVLGLVALVFSRAAWLTSRDAVTASREATRLQGEAESYRIYRERTKETRPWAIDMARWVDQTYASCAQIGESTPEISALAGNLHTIGERLGEPTYKRLDYLINKSINDVLQAYHGGVIEDRIVTAFKGVSIARLVRYWGEDPDALPQLEAAEDRFVAGIERYFEAVRRGDLTSVPYPATPEPPVRKWQFLS